MRTKTSKYKGVSWKTHIDKWEAGVQLNKQKYFLGYFINEIDAAKAYNDFRIRMQRNHAKTNELDELIYCPECKKDLTEEDFYNNEKYVKGKYGVCKKCQIKYTNRNRTAEGSAYETYTIRHFGSYGKRDKNIPKLIVAIRILKLIERGKITFERGQQTFNGVTSRQSAIRAFEQKLR